MHKNELNCMIQIVLSFATFENRRHQHLNHSTKSRQKVISAVKTLKIN